MVLAKLVRAGGLAVLGAGALLAGSPRVLAESAPYLPARFRHFTVADGLSDARTRALLQDSRGFLWVGTVDGLDRYDGLRFRTFRHDASVAGSLGQGVPAALAEDGQGRIWVGLLGGGLSRYDPSTERFTRYRHDPGDPSSLASDYVQAVLVDPDGSVWAGTRVGLCRLDAKSGRFTRFLHDPADPEGLSSNEVTSLRRDRKGALWVGTGGGGLNRLVPGVGDDPPRFERWRHDPQDRRSLSSDDVRALLEDREGRLWVGTWDTGLNRLDADERGFVRYRSKIHDATTLGADRIYDLKEDHAGRIWVATWGGGLCALDPRTGRAMRFSPDPGDPDGLSHANVTTVYEDRGGLLWITTAGGGLHVLDLEAKGFRRHAVTGPRPGGLTTPDVRSVLRDRQGDLWVGTAGGGLHRIDRDGRTVERFRHRPDDPGSLADDNVWALLEDRRGTLWVGTFGGLDRFDPRSRRFLHHRHDPRDAGSLSNDTVYALHEDGQGRLWIGTWRGLNRLDGEGGRFVRYPVQRQHPETDAADPIVSITDDAAGNVWLGAHQLLFRLDPATGDRTRFSPEPELEAMDGPPFYRVLKRDAGGRVWVTTKSGVAELLPRAAGPPEFRVLAVAPEGGIVASIERADDGTLWLGTSRGLVRYDARNNRVRLYDRAHGLAGDSFSWNASFRTPQNELLFGAAEGLTSFLPERIRDDTKAPPVVMTGLRLGAREVTPGDPLLPRALPETIHVHVPAEERAVTLEFAALSFRAAERNRYRYRLEGFEREWNELRSGRREVTYTNLRPGSYLFRVVAANADGVWNEEGASLAIDVLPPWWNAWWFRSLSVLGLAALLVSAHWLRLRAISHRTERLEQEVRERQLAQQTLAQSERQMRLIADALPVLIAYVAADRRCLFANLASERWIGRPRDSLAGQPIERILPADVLAAAQPHIARALGGRTESYEFAGISTKGEKRLIAATLIPHGNGDGTVLGFFTLAQDITKRVRTEEAFRRQHDQLAHASRVLTLGELAAALAHELNQPLTAILGNAQAARRLHAQGPESAPEVAETLDDIARETSRAGEIIRRLRELVRRGEARRAPLDLNQAILGLEPLLRSAALEHDVDLSLELHPDLPTVLGDGVQVQQVVLNLARNGLDALRAVPREGRRLRIRTALCPESAVVEVIDSGPPLEAELVAKLFAPFYTTKPDGLGMGLAITRSIVEAHGGRIVAERNPTGGLTLRVNIPWPRSESARP